MFDTDTFLNTQTSEATSTEYENVPEGEYNAVVDKLEARQAGNSNILEVHWKIDAPGDDLADGRSVRQSIWLDTSPAGALLTGPGKNVQLGRTRAALGQNADGEPWAPNMMLGQVAIVKVKHTMRDERTFANVSAVTGI